MTDAIAASAPLKITIHPQPQAATPDAGRLVNANPTPGNVPDSPDFWGQGGISFKTVLDTLNPLQQIPGVSKLYQALTGDVPSSGSNLAGGALFGGPIGFAAALIGEISKAQTGKDISGNMLALLQGKSDIQIAQNTAPDGSPYLSPSQRAAYNAYVSLSRATQSGGTGSISA
jgi:hypothetical protein